jgi:hypothetical protein
MWNDRNYHYPSFSYGKMSPEDYADERVFGFAYSDCAWEGGPTGVLKSLSFYFGWVYFAILWPKI